MKRATTKKATAENVLIAPDVYVSRAFIAELQHCDPLGAELTLEEVAAILTTWYPRVNPHGRQRLQRTFGAWWPGLKWKDVDRAKERLRMLRTPRRDEPSREPDDHGDALDDDFVASFVKGSIGEK